ncbi:predicted protein [Naegleria gruberi]|uniref:Predicted protein n=1 Tax=Naegleria gruberi TaxID=5762 RepID=D2V2M5_NAEGR|nr:uncharacterized protein NAEGRDRAFT_46201 [Naegleria gruberi]EFC49084.1 predicted protein [Naegleria gruberi]|eukprot:XP_002681828.1 predicted protein [Naegleria gruberi strain NEG-M]
MGENPHQVTHEHHHFYHGGKKVASTSVRVTDQGVIEDVKVMEHNPASKVVSFIDSKYSNYNSERLSKLKSKLNTLTSSLESSTKSSGSSGSNSKDEDKLKKKIKQQKKEIEGLTRELKDLQSTASRSIASHQSPLLLSPKEEEPLVSEDYTLYTIKRYLTVLKQGSYGNSATDQKNFLETLNYLESKLDKIVSDKNSQIEKHITDKIDAERKSKILESERDFAKRELEQKESELENVSKEKDRVSKTLFSAEEDIVRLQKAIEQMTKNQEEDTEITQKMIEKIIEKERSRIRKKMSGEYQKEIDDLKNHITQLGAQIQRLKETHDAREKEIMESKEEAALFRIKSADVEKLKQLLKESIERERKLEENLGNTINMNQSLTKELDLSKKVLHEIELSIHDSTYLEKSSLFKQKIGTLSPSSQSLKFKAIVDMCDELAKLNSNLREKVKTTQANNDLLSQELLQLHKVKLETSSSQKLYQKEKEILAAEVEEIKENFKESVRKAQQESESLSKVIQEKQSVIEKYKEIIESKGNNVESLEQENRDRNDKLKQFKKEVEEKQQEYEELSKEHRDLGIKCTKLLREIEELKEEDESKSSLITQLKSQIERLTSENHNTISRIEELELVLENNGKKD